MNLNNSPMKPRPRVWPLAIGGIAALVVLRIYAHLTHSGIVWYLIGQRLFDLVFWIVTLALLIWAVADWMQAIAASWASPPAPAPALVADPRFTSERITQTFVSAITQLTSQLNLELATATHTELFERTERSSLWGLIDLGDNSAQIRLAVTYRYHLHLLDPWQLKVAGNTLLVIAPPIRASLPPAIHTDAMFQQTSRGWCRMPPSQLLADLHRDLTPAVSLYAADPRRIALVRETCRQAVVQFVQRWLEGEQRWRPDRFTAIHVRFADEPAVPVMTEAPPLKRIQNGD